MPNYSSRVVDIRFLTVASPSLETPHQLLDTAWPGNSKFKVYCITSTVQNVVAVAQNILQVRSTDNVCSTAADCRTTKKCNMQLEAIPHIALMKGAQWHDWKTLFFSESLSSYSTAFLPVYTISSNCTAGTGSHTVEACEHCCQRSQCQFRCAPKCQNFPFYFSHVSFSGQRTSALHTSQPNLHLK